MDVGMVMWKSGVVRSGFADWVNKPGSGFS